ncbi:MAG: hypothetical protein ABIJ15_09025 [bacterium]
MPEQKQIRKNGNPAAKPEDPIKSIEKQIFDLQSTLESSISRITEGKIVISEVGRISENILRIIPVIRKKTAALKIEKAFQKYEKILVGTGVNPALIDFIVKKRRERIGSKLFILNPDVVTAIEKKLGIFSGGKPDGPDIFIKLNNLLSHAKDPNEIEAIVRKIRANLEAKSEKAVQLEKEDAIRHFVEEAGFEEQGDVIEFLFHENLTAAIRDEHITRKKLAIELQTVDGKITKLGRQLLAAFDKKYSSIKNSMPKEPSLFSRIISDYFATPVMATAGAIGTLTVIIYGFGRFGTELAAAHFPEAAEIFNSTGIPVICRMLKPAPVFITGFGCIFLAGLVKMLDENFKKTASGPK